jgi:hypothetical protein
MKNFLVVITAVLCTGRIVLADNIGITAVSETYHVWGLAGDPSSSYDMFGTRDLHGHADNSPAYDPGTTVESEAVPGSADCEPFELYAWCFNCGYPRTYAAIAWAEASYIFTPIYPVTEVSVGATKLVTGSDDGCQTAQILLTDLSNSKIILSLRTDWPHSQDRLQSGWTYDLTLDSSHNYCLWANVESDGNGAVELDSCVYGVPEPISLLVLGIGAILARSHGLGQLVSPR